MSNDFLFFFPLSYMILKEASSDEQPALWVFMLNRTDKLFAYNAGNYPESALFSWISFIIITIKIKVLDRKSLQCLTVGLMLESMRSSCFQALTSLFFYLWHNVENDCDLYWKVTGFYCELCTKGRRRQRETNAFRFRWIKDGILAYMLYNPQHLE